jgi:dTDP-4-dehydrorhamnose reductase
LLLSQDVPDPAALAHAVSDSQRRMFVLGHRGMLGHVVARYAAASGYEVVTTDVRYEGGPSDPLIAAVRESGADVVINCLGLTKQRSDDPAALYLANALFPVHLAQQLQPAQYIVHASSDCVFAGVRGGYRFNDPLDASDSYGFSKALGESIRRCPNVTVLRVSVIGPDRGDGHGLLAWFLRQPPERPVAGYINHRWNGITTLEWAAIAIQCADARARGEGVRSLIQPGTAVVTKYELLCAFRDLYAPYLTVAQASGATSVDRSLIPSDPRPAIRQQLQQLGAWYPVPATGA